jgi:hypothetical protein
MTLPFIVRSLNVGLLLFGAAGLCHADTVWQCWYDHALHVACSLTQSAPATPLDPQQKRALALGVAARPGQFQPLVQVLHTNPGALKGQYVRIPVYTDPTDPDFVAELAQSILCGKQTDCRANYGSRPPPRDLDTATAMADAIDPMREIVPSGQGD